MHLLSEELRHKLPRLGSDETTALEDKLVLAKFFDPTLSWRWYVIEYDGDDTFFGIVMAGDNALAGQFTLSELKSLRYRPKGQAEIGVERDNYFRPITLKELSDVEPSVGDLLKRPGLDLVDLKR